MEPKILHLLSCILLLFLPHHFSLFTHADSTHHQLDAQKPSAIDFLQTLTGARKGTTSKGISQLKKYLSHIGYMNRENDTAPTDGTDDLFDDNLELAVKSYQTFFKLEVNGITDANTIAKMSLTRCGVPDWFSLNSSHELYPHVPTFSSHYTFFPGAPKWPLTKRSLTYSFPQGTRADVHNPILHATQMWASVSHFRFTYTPNYDQADIKISFEYRDHGDGHPFDGPGGILAHAFAPVDGRLHYDGDERWVDGVIPGGCDMQTVGLHELGHNLGLGHTTDENNIMFPLINYGQRKFIGQDDINGIRALYRS